MRLVQLKITDLLGPFQFKNAIIKHISMSALGSSCPNSEADLFVIIDGLFVCGRAFHHYRGLHDPKEPLKKHEELDRLLREEFCSLDDFRAKENTMP